MKNVYVVEDPNNDYRRVYFMTEEQYKAVSRVLDDFHDLTGEIYIAEPYDVAEEVE